MYWSIHWAAFMRSFPHGWVLHFWKSFLHELLSRLLTTHPIEDGFNHIESLFFNLMINWLLRSGWFSWILRWFNFELLRCFHQCFKLVCCHVSSLWELIQLCFRKSQLLWLRNLLPWLGSTSLGTVFNTSDYLIVHLMR